MNAAAETILSAVRDRGIAALFEPEMISLAAGMGSIDWIADQAGATDDQIGEWKTKIDLFKQANGQPGNGGPEFDVFRDEPGAEEGTSPPGGEQAGQRAPRFKLVAFDDIRLSRESQYVVRGIIPRAGLVVIWGPPKCGKSFWISDLALHVALGWSYRGRRVKQGPVVYIALEGTNGLNARVEAFRVAHPDLPNRVPFFVIGDQVNLTADHKAIIADIHAQIGDAMPILVVIDTLNRSLAGSENDPKDMALYVRAADAVREAFGCAVAIVHHCGVNEIRPRGHTSLTGAADAQLAVIRDTNGNVRVEVEFMKDGPQGALITSRLEVVEVSTDEDGEVDTSCIIVEAETAAAPAKQARKARSTRALQDAIVEALDAHGAETVVNGHKLRATILDHVHAEFCRRYVAKGKDPAKVADAKRNAFNRALERMPAGYGMGAVNGTDMVWRAQ